MRDNPVVIMKDNLFNSAPMPGPKGLALSSEQDARIARTLVDALSGAAQIEGLPDFESLKKALVSGGLEKEVTSWVSRKPDLSVAPKKLEDALGGTKVVETLLQRTRLPK